MRSIFVVIISVLFFAGCAANQANQPGSGSRIDNLKSQLQTKTKEVGALTDQMRALQSQLDSARQAKDNCERRLDDALNKLSRRKSGSSKVIDYAK